MIAGAGNPPSPVLLGDGAFLGDKTSATNSSGAAGTGTLLGVDRGHHDFAGSTNPAASGLVHVALVTEVEFILPDLVFLELVPFLEEVMEIFLVL